MMDATTFVWTYLLSRKCKAFRRNNRRKKQSVKRRKAIARRQSEERVLSMSTLKMISLSWLVPPSKQFGPQNVAVTVGSMLWTLRSPHMTGLRNDCKSWSKSFQFPMKTQTWRRLQTCMKKTRSWRKLSLTMMAWSNASSVFYMYARIWLLFQQLSQHAVT